jgi:hypothetical protein
MLRRYLPWLKDERAEFVLEVVSTLSLAVAIAWYWA